jgi:hypothetical protein
LRLITAHCHRSNRDKLLNRKKEEKKTDDWLLREIVYRSPIGTRSRLKRFLALLISRHVRFQRGRDNNKTEKFDTNPKKLQGTDTRLMTLRITFRVCLHRGRCTFPKK